jgi:transcriptional regulator with XRE-family HTH domain
MAGRRYEGGSRHGSPGPNGPEPDNDDLPAEVMAQLEAWVKNMVRPEDWRSAPLKGTALEALLDALPDESLTAGDIERLERRRRIAQEAKEGIAGLPLAVGEAFDALCDKEHVEKSDVARAFGVNVEALYAVLRGERSLFELSASRLPAVARSLRMDLWRLIITLELVARRALLTEVQRRTQLALNRSDRLQAPDKVRADTLRLALATAEKENRSAARFFAEARRLLRNS